MGIVIVVLVSVSLIFGNAEETALPPASNASIVGETCCARSTANCIVYQLAFTLVTTRGGKEYTHSRYQIGNTGSGYDSQEFRRGRPRISCTATTLRGWAGFFFAGDDFSWARGCSKGRRISA